MVHKYTWHRPSINLEKIRFHDDQQWRRRLDHFWDLLIIIEVMCLHLQRSLHVWVIWRRKDNQPLYYCAKLKRKRSLHCKRNYSTMKTNLNPYHGDREFFGDINFIGSSSSKTDIMSKMFETKKLFSIFLIKNSFVNLCGCCYNGSHCPQQTAACVPPSLW